MADWCPRCDQGWVREYVARGQSEVIRLCEECEALWRAGEQVTKEHFGSFDDYMAALGLAPLWSEISPVN
ncbi:MULTISPECIES: hypothetical protein [unclassified Kitasatospora]